MGAVALKNTRMNMKLSTLTPKFCRAIVVNFFKAASYYYFATNYRKSLKGTINRTKALSRKREQSSANRSTSRTCGFADDALTIAVWT